jgi:hypothetical protein
VVGFEAASQFLVGVVSSDGAATLRAVKKKKNLYPKIGSENSMLVLEITDGKKIHMIA